MEEAVKLINENQSLADFGNGISSDAIKKAEGILGLKFPPSYVYFLEHYGCGNFGGFEVYGIFIDPETDRPVVPNGIWLTLKNRNNFQMLHHFLIIGSPGYGPYYVLDLSIINENGESPVCLWTVGNVIEKVEDSFEQFFLNGVRSELEDI